MNTGDHSDCDKAVADYTEAVRLNPKDTAAYCGRGVAYGKLGELDNAIADFSEAIGIDPKYAHAYCNRGIIYRKKGDYDKAIADYTGAIRLDSKDAVAYVNRGNAYADQSEFDKAIADFSEANGNGTQIGHKPMKHLLADAGHWGLVHQLGDGGSSEQLAALLAALLPHTEDESFLGRVLEEPLNHVTVGSPRPQELWDGYG
jgi:tetratricopeptide (TPR) repeat protein